MNHPKPGQPVKIVDVAERKLDSKRKRAAHHKRIVSRTIESFMTDWDAALSRVESPVAQARIDASYRKACQRLQRQSKSGGHR